MDERTNRARPEYVSIDTLCEMFQLNKKTIRNWTSAKRIPYHKIGGLVRFNLREIEQWFDQQKVATIQANPLNLMGR